MTETLPDRAGLGFALNGANNRRGLVWCIVPLGIMLLAACDPQQVADQVGRRAAASVVLPVVQAAMPTPVAQKATDCIVRNASADEVQALVRDVGVVAGSSTKANIRTIAIRPEAAACFAANGVPPVLP